MSDMANPPVGGVDVGSESRCSHYHSDRDVVAIKFPCCDEYYACFECHEACSDHAAEQWPADRFGEPAVLCGVCGVELTVKAYRNCEHTCPVCSAAFNPGCAAHADRYFAVAPADSSAETASNRKDEGSAEKTDQQ